LEDGVKNLKTRIWDGEDMLFFDDPFEWDIKDYGDYVKLAGRPRMLFTGLQDAKGTDIYGDDIIFMEGKGLHIVRWDSDANAWALGGLKDTFRWLKTCYKDLYTVTGNIHEDPEGAKEIK
jgi:hypothetical protein